MAAHGRNFPSGESNETSRGDTFSASSMIAMGHLKMERRSEVEASRGDERRYALELGYA